jgi:acyl-CoA dehydrogenase
MNRPDFGPIDSQLDAALRALSKATAFLIKAQADGHLTEALAGATPYLRLFGLTAGGTLLAKGALHAAENGEGEGWVSLANFFAENALGETAALAGTVMEGADALEKAAATHLLSRTGQG